MRPIVSTFARILRTLAMLIVFAGPLYADPVVAIIEGGDNPLNVPSLETVFGGFVIDQTGGLRLRFRNGTSFTFLDLHIRFSPPLNVPPNVDGGTIFDDFTPTTDGVDFVVGGSGTGVRPGRTITIIFENFPPGTTVTEITNTIPEPASLLLLGTGVAGAAIKVRKKLKGARSKP